MKTHAVVIAILGTAALGTLGHQQELRADLAGLLAKVPTTLPTPTTAPVAKQTKAAASGLLAKAESLAGNPAIPTTKPTTRPATTQPAANLTAQAETELDQALAYLKANRLDLADKTLSAVEQHKASLPAALQTQVASARTMLDAAKATSGAGISLPKL